MNSIFYPKGNAPVPEAYRLGKSVITIPGGDRLVVQGAGFNYQRGVSFMLPLNMDKKILIAGEPQGTLQLDIIIGPSKGVAAFLARYADVCALSAQDNTIVITPTGGCDDMNTTAGAKWTFTGCLIANLQGKISRTEQGNIVVPSISMIFSDMGMDDE